jgi:hypothetical protein
MNIYFHLVVHSYYKQLKSIAPNTQETTTPRPDTALSVAKTYPSQPATPLTQYLLQVPNLPPIQYLPHKRLPKLGDAAGNEHFGSMVSWTEPDYT